MDNIKLGIKRIQDILLYFRNDTNMQCLARFRSRTRKRLIIYFAAFHCVIYNYLKVGEQS